MIRLCLFSMLLVIVFIFRLNLSLVWNEKLGFYDAMLLCYKMLQNKRSFLVLLIIAGSEFEFSVYWIRVCCAVYVLSITKECDYFEKESFLQERHGVFSDFFMRLLNHFLFDSFAIFPCLPIEYNNCCVARGYHSS